MEISEIVLSKISPEVSGASWSVIQSSCAYGVAMMANPVSLKEAESRAKDYHF